MADGAFLAPGPPDTPWAKRVMMKSRVNGETLTSARVVHDHDLVPSLSIDPQVIKHFERDMAEQQAAMIVDEMKKFEKTRDEMASNLALPTIYQDPGTDGTTTSTITSFTASDIKTLYVETNAMVQDAVKRRWAQVHWESAFNEMREAPTPSYIRSPVADETLPSWAVFRPKFTASYNNTFFTDATNTDVCYHDMQSMVRKDPKQAIRDILKKQQAPEVIVINRNRKSIENTDCVKENNARQTLRTIVGAAAYRKFLKYGFVSAKAKSGLVYQMFQGHKVTRVYQNGELIERLCVVLEGGYTPTDSIIMRYLMIMSDEKGFRDLAIPHSVAHDRDQHQEQRAPRLVLTDEFRRLKEAA